MVRRVFRGAVLCACFTLLGYLVLQANLAQAHGPGSACDGSCQAQGNSNVATPNQSPYFQQSPYPQPYTPQLGQPMPPSGYGASPRTFANSTGHDCPICRAEQAQSLAASSNNMAAAPNNFDPSMDRPRLMPRYMPPRQAGYPMADPYARGMRPNMPRGFQTPLPGAPIPVEPMIAGQDRGLMPTAINPQQMAIPDGMALVLQDDSPLMNGNDQLGSIDRGQTLRVLNIQGNWVQLETDWLGKNTWIRKNLVRMNDSIQPPNDIAPPAT